jgi:hypothetical protein
LPKKCNGPCGTEKELSEFNPTNAWVCNGCKEVMGGWQRTYCDGKHPRHDKDVYDELPTEVDSILDTLSGNCDGNLLQIIHEGMSMLIDRMEEKTGR